MWPAWVQQGFPCRSARLLHNLSQKHKSRTIMPLQSRSSRNWTFWTSPQEVRIFFVSSDKSSMHTINLSGVFGAILKRVGMCSFVAKITVMCAWLILSMRQILVAEENNQCSHMYSGRVSVKQYYRRIHMLTNGIFAQSVIKTDCYFSVALQSNINHLPFWTRKSIRPFN